jgi:hypothetical protein
MIINETIKKNAMNKEEILEIVMHYANELKEDYEELRDNYGSSDSATQQAVTQWLVIDKLLYKLGLNDD